MLSAVKDPLTFDELMATPIDFSKFAMNRLKIDKLTKAHLVRPVYNILNDTCQSSIELEYNMEECYKALSDQLNWNNPEGDRYLEKKYTTLITKTKAARYELVGIEDMISSLWSVTNIGYDKDADVKVNKLHGYGYLEEIMVRKVDRQLYKIKEGDFVNLHLNDIEDMLLLVVQHKLFQLDDSEIVDLAVALRMFTRSLIIKRRVEDVQLGVESYQKKLSITKPQEDFPGISSKELYTPSFDPPGAVYEDLNKRKRVMRADKLYKFSDGTLKLVRDELHHRVLNFRFGLNKEMSRRKWSATYRRRSELMVDLIDKQMRERRILRNLERLVGARELEMDYMLT
ncbi:hypothetical protein Tco_1254746 [Tanacetum coccineum]